MRVYQKTGRVAATYCTECESPDSYTVEFSNQRVVQQATFALCPKHAEQLASLLLQKVRASRRVAAPLPTVEGREP